MPDSDHNLPEDQPQPVPTEQSILAPVPAVERISSVDVLRGVALFGILVMNILTFGLPKAAMDNPTVAGGVEGLNLLTWQISQVFFYQKFLAVFSMLFGAGLILMYNRARTAGREFTRVYYFRILWLLVIGLIHAYFLWWGDILVSYAICGLLIYIFRRRSPKTLIIIGVVGLMIAVGFMFGAGAFFDFARQNAEEVAEIEQSGGTPEKGLQQLAEAWENIETAMNPSGEIITEEIEIHRGSYGGILAHRIPVVLMLQTQALLFFIIWYSGGMMLIGMGLMKLGVFSAERSARFYLVLGIIGYGVGLTLTYSGAGRILQNGFDFVNIFKTNALFNYTGALFVALGHVSLVMLFCRSGMLGWLQRGLAAVGRMALTNYLMHTIVFTTIFYGYGLGLFGTVERSGLMVYVAGMWIVQLIISPIWLTYYRFGPAEWLWRSLTYRKMQPFAVKQLTE